MNNSIEYTNFSWILAFRIWNGLKNVESLNSGHVIVVSQEYFNQCQ